MFCSFYCDGFGVFGMNLFGCKFFFKKGYVFCVVDGQFGFNNGFKFEKEVVEVCQLLIEKEVKYVFIDVDIVVYMSKVLEQCLQFVEVLLRRFWILRVKVEIVVFVFYCDFVMVDGWYVGFLIYLQFYVFFFGSEIIDYFVIFGSIGVVEKWEIFGMMWYIVKVYRSFFDMNDGSVI